MKINMKTNKSFLKRVKITKKGKILIRKPGVSHLNAKKSREKQIKCRKMIYLNLDKKLKSNLLPFS